MGHLIRKIKAWFDKQWADSHQFYKSFYEESMQVEEVIYNDSQFKELFKKSFTPKQIETLVEYLNRVKYIMGIDTLKNIHTVDDIRYRDGAINILNILIKVMKVSKEEETETMAQLKKLLKPQIG